MLSKVGLQPAKYIVDGECIEDMLEIRKEGDPVLRQVAKPVAKIDKELLDLAAGMIKAMYEADGIGLAAPQVGEPVRLVVFDIGDGPVTMINPHVTRTEGEVEYEERCLSVPGKFAYITRPDYVEVKYLDRTGKVCTVDGDGILARCLLHELDHLEGKLYVDMADKVFLDEREKKSKKGAAAE